MVLNIILQFLNVSRSFAIIRFMFDFNQNILFNGLNNSYTNAQLVHWEIELESESIWISL